MLHPVLVCCYNALLPNGVNTHWHPVSGTWTLNLVQGCQAYLSKRKTNRILPKYIVLSAHWCKLASILHWIGSASAVILNFLVSNAYMYLKLQYPERASSCTIIYLTHDVMIGESEMYWPEPFKFLPWKTYNCNEGERATTVTYLSSCKADILETGQHGVGGHLLWPS